MNPNRDSKNTNDPMSNKDTKDHPTHSKHDKHERDDRHQKHDSRPTSKDFKPDAVLDSNIPQPVPRGEGPPLVSSIIHSSVHNSWNYRGPAGM